MAAGSAPFLSLTSSSVGGSKLLEGLSGRSGGEQALLKTESSFQDDSQPLPEPDMDGEGREQRLTTTTARSIWKFLSGTSGGEQQEAKTQGNGTEETTTMESMIATNRMGLLRESEQWAQLKEGADREGTREEEGALLKRKGISDDQGTNQILNNLISSRIGGTFVPAGMHTQGSRASCKEGIIGFSLVRATKESLQGKRGRISFENTFTDLNQAWDPKRSMFKCREPGLYFFSFNGRGQAEPADRFWIVSLMLNGVEVVSVGGTEESGSSNTILLPLNKNDEVWLQLMQGHLIESNDRSRTGLTSFSGYRVGGIHPTDINPDFSEEKLAEEPLEDIQNRHNLAFFDRSTEDRYNSLDDRFEFLDSRERNRVEFRDKLDSVPGSQFSKRKSQVRPEWDNRLSNPAQREPSRQRPEPHASSWNTAGQTDYTDRGTIRSPERPDQTNPHPVPVRRYYYPQWNTSGHPRDQTTEASTRNEIIRQRLGSHSLDHRHPFTSLLESSRSHGTKDQSRRPSSTSKSEESSRSSLYSPLEQLASASLPSRIDKKNSLSVASTTARIGIFANLNGFEKFPKGLFHDPSETNWDLEVD
eukprot:maker-scaffold95_size379157-snap-gene-2.33 protein:Tk00602 transcript:maker-scaffold95_size379157-snap-gene-2.33-mRNA-1 annotation:"complement component q subcomponent-like protein"